MAHRILIGSRTVGGYGLYVSQSGDDVLTTTEPLLFDSRAGNSWTIKKVQEGTIAANGAPQTVTHNLGYYPMVAVRFSHSITNGYATEVYDHVWASEMEEGPTQGPDPDQWEKIINKDVIGHTLVLMLLLYIINVMRLMQTMVLLQRRLLVF